MAQNLNARSFPAGTDPTLVDTLIRQQQTVTTTSQKTDQNTNDLAQVQKAVNTLSTALETTTATADSALNTANSAQAAAIAAQQTANNANSNIGTVNQNAVFKNVSAEQTVQGPLGASEFRVGGNKVVGARVGGFSAASGTQQRGAINSDTGYAASAAYSQAELRAVGDGLSEVRRVVVAILAALQSHGAIGS